jgi:hypothetical protein
MLEVKTTELEMRSNFDGLISRLDMGEKAIMELKDRTMEISQI